MATTVLLAPIVVAVIAAAMHLLPLDSRVSLWLGPPLLMLSAAGVAAIGEWLSARFSGAPATIGAAIAATALGSAVVIEPPPYRTQDLRPVLQAVAAEWQPGDAAYVYYGARQAVRFYAPRAGPKGWTEGACHRGETRAYFRELDQFRGQPRVWVIWTHALARYREPEAVRSYLSTIGRQLQRVDPPAGGDPPDAQALLYDLSDTARLARASAESHAVPAEDPAERAVPCGGPANDASVVR